MSDHALPLTAGAMAGWVGWTLAAWALEALVTVVFVLVRNPDRLYRSSVRLAAHLWTKDSERAEAYAEEWQAIGEELRGRLPKVRMALSFLTFGAVRRGADTVQWAVATLAECARRTARPIRRPAAMSKLVRIGELGLRRWRALGTKIVAVTIVGFGAVYCGMAMGNQVGWVPVVTILVTVAAPLAIVVVAATEAYDRR